MGTARFEGHGFGGPRMHRHGDQDEQHEQDDGGATPGSGVESGLFRS